MTSPSKEDMQIIAVADEQCMQFFINEYVGERTNDAELLADLSRVIISVVNEIHSTVVVAREEKVTIEKVCASAGIDRLTYHTLYVMSARAAKNVETMLQQGMLKSLDNLPACGATKNTIIKTVADCIAKLTAPTT